MQFAQRISLPLLFSIMLLFLLHSATANGADSYQVCDTTSNLTANSTYQSNLGLLFSSLTTNSTSSTSISGFAKDTIGSVPNRISGLVLCCGDVNSSTCSSCLSQATTDVQNLCPYNKDATIYYDYCLLRYSNHQFLTSTDQGSQAVYIPDDRNATGSITCFADLVIDLMTSIGEYASNNNSVKFGTAMMMKTSNLFPAIYGLVQCTPVLSDSDCMACLTGYILTWLSGRQGGKVFGWMCSLRYEWSFDAEADTTCMRNRTSPEFVAFSDSSHTDKMSGTDLAIAIPVGVAFIAILALCVCLMKRRRAKLIQLVSKEMKNVESLLLDLSLLRVATINFANENKLGEGGFGSVYKGVLPDGREIAAKRLSKTSNQGLGELKNELELHYTYKPSHPSMTHTHITPKSIFYFGKICKNKIYKLKRAPTLHEIALVISLLILAKDSAQSPSIPMQNAGFEGGLKGTISLLSIITIFDIIDRSAGLF